MADPVSWIAIGVSAIFGLVGASQSSQAQAEQDKAQADAEAAQRAQWETELATHQFNLDLAKEGLSTGLADFTREGARDLGLQGAAMGASGATLGVGTPLMNMIRMAASIERDKAGLTRTAELEIAFRQGEIDKLTGLINPPKPIEPLEPLKKKKPTSTGGRDRTGSANLGRA